MVVSGSEGPNSDDASDEDLLIQMSLQKSEPDSAKAAWKSFHDRHMRYIHGHCWGVLYEHLGGRYSRKALWGMAADLAADVMIRVYQKAETFQLRGSRDPDQMRWQVRGWLGTIARNIVCDWLTGRGHESGSQSVEDIPQDTVVDYQDPPNPRLVCVGKILDGLPEKERMVVLAYMDHYDTRKGSGRISNEESKQLAEALGMTTASLRQVKRRALQRIREEIESKCNGLDTE